jgi:hypothetical protein
LHPAVERRALIRMNHFLEDGGLEELGPEQPNLAERDLLKKRSVGSARRSLQDLPAPAVLLDPSLRFLWVNPAFCECFGDGAPTEGAHLPVYFAESFGDEARESLYRSLKTPAGGYCWYGRIEKRGVDERPVITNLFILPLFDGRGSVEPVAFQGLFDDISADHRRMLRSTYQSLLEAARLKDNDTGNHIERVNRYSRRMASALLSDPSYPEVDAEYVENIGFLAAMHDVGKIGTPDDILNKGGPLEPWEWEIMKEHTINGAYILASYPNPMAKDIALRHHEQWDGSGYPHGVAEGMIPLCARIVAIADVYDALRTKRPYKEPLSHQEASLTIREQSGHQFDPALVEHFARLEPAFVEIFEALKEQPEAGTRRAHPSSPPRG